MIWIECIKGIEIDTNKEVETEESMITLKRTCAFVWCVWWWEAWGFRVKGPQYSNSNSSTSTNYSYQITPWINDKIPIPKIWNRFFNSIPKHESTSQRSIALCLCHKNLPFLDCPFAYMLSALGPGSTCIRDPYSFVSMTCLWHKYKGKWFLYSFVFLLHFFRSSFEID